MKYTININQYAFQKFCKSENLDIVDAAIMDSIISFSRKKACEKIKTGGKTYFWISHSLLLEDLPMSGIKSKVGIRRRINKLIKANLLIAYKDNQILGRSYYRISNDFYKIFSKGVKYEPKINKNIHPLLRADYKFAKGSNLEGNLKLLQEENKTNRELKKQILNMEYKNFLRTPYWKTIAMYLKSKHHFCAICHSDKALRVHHSTYINHGEEALHLEDLVVLCDECHKKFHGIENNKEEK